MDEKESKRARFIRLADDRTNKIINMNNLLGNLPNTSSYEYTGEDVERIYNYDGTGKIKKQVPYIG